MRRKDPSGKCRRKPSSHGTIHLEIHPYLCFLCFSHQSLLKADYIAHKIVPVSGYTDLSKANQNLIENIEEVRHSPPAVVVLQKKKNRIENLTTFES